MVKKICAHLRHLRILPILDKNMNRIGNCGWLARFSSLLLSLKLSKTSKATLSGRIVSRSLLQLILLLISALSVVAEPNPIPGENAKPGNPRSEWDINGSGDPVSRGLRRTLASIRGRLSDSRSRPTDELQLRYLPAWVLRRSRRETGRRLNYPHSASSEPAQPDYE